MGVEQSLLTHLEDRNGALLDAAVANVDVAKTLTCLVSNLVNLCNKKSCKLSEVRFGTVEINYKKLKAKILFDQHGYEPPLYEKEKNWMSRKNIRMVRAMHQNPAFLRFFGSVINALEIYARSKNRRYTSLRVEKAIIDRDDHLVMELNF
jgi:hypothetical protein